MKASIIYILSRFVYLLVAGIMNRKIGIDQALEYILQPGSDLERSKLSDSESDEEPTVKPKKGTMFLDGDQVNSFQEITYSKKKVLLSQIWIMLKHN